jgi:putative DNA primase/helicase
MPDTISSIEWGAASLDASIAAGSNKPRPMADRAPAPTNVAPLPTDEERVPEPPTLAQEGYHGILRELVDAACESSEADPPAVAAHYMGRLTGMFGRPLYLEIGDKRIGLKFWPLIIGGTNAGRKGTADDLPSRVISNACKRLSTQSNGLEPELRELGALATGEGLIHAIRDASDDVDGDGGDSGVPDKRLVVTDAEFSSTLIKAQRKDSILSPVLRKAFDGGRLDNPTRGKPYRTSRPHVVVIGHITPRELRERLTLAECANGFANRFMPIYTRRPKLVPLPKPTPLRRLEALAEETAMIVSQARGVLDLNADYTVLIDMTAKAEILWNEIYPALVADRPGIIGELTQRAPLHCRILAALFALLDLKKMVEPEHLRAAKAWLDYAIATVEYIFAVGGQQAQVSRIFALAERILGVLAGKGELTRTEIHRALNGHVPAGDIDAALGELLARRPAPIQQRSEKTEGRTRTVFSVCVQSVKSAETPGGNTGPRLSTLNTLSTQSAPAAVPGPDAEVFCSNGCGRSIDPT